MLSRARIVAILGMAVLLLGCSFARTVLPSLDQRSDKEIKEDGFRRCSGVEPRKWDLGSGRLEDIARLAPDFYTYSAGDGKYANERRVYLLEHAELPDGIALEERVGNGHRLVEFKGKESPPAQLVAYSLMFDGERAVGFFIAPAACPHVTVEEACVDREWLVKVESTEQIGCVDGRSGPLKLTAAGMDETEVYPGQLVVLPQAGMVTLSDAEGTVRREQIRPDVYVDASPAVVFILLVLDSDRQAARAYRAVAPEWMSDEFKVEYAKARKAKLLEVTQDLPTRVAGRRAVASTDLDPALPGADDLREVAQKLIEASFQEIASDAVSTAAFNEGLQALDAAPEPEGIDTKEFSVKYGRALASGTIDGPPDAVTKARAAYVTRWPTSPHVPAIRLKIAEDLRREEEARVEEAQSARRVQLGEGVWERGKEVIVLRHRVQWGRAHLPATPHNAEGLRQLQLLSEVRKQEFCAARAELLETVSVREYQALWQATCDAHAPTEDLGTGPTVLTAECRAFFAEGCP